jgi:hypothetical protein
MSDEPLARVRANAMTMPPQLARAKRPKQTTPRPIVETLPRIDIGDLCRFNVFPDQCNWNARHYFEMPFRYNFVKSFVISLKKIEANHYSGYTQSIPLRWCATGFGGKWRPRPLLVCQCGRSVRKLYFKAGHLACRRCCNATYASRTCSKRLRPILQAKRLQAFLEFKRYMSKRNRQRIKAVFPQRQAKTSKANASLITQSNTHNTTMAHKARCTADEMQMHGHRGVGAPPAADLRSLARGDVCSDHRTGEN